MTNPHLQLARGLPRSGKTAFLRQWQVENPGSLLFDPASWGLSLHPGIEPGLLWRLTNRVAREFVSQGRSFALDLPSLRNSELRHWYNFARRAGYSFAVQELPIHVDAAIRADARTLLPHGDRRIRELARGIEQARAAWEADLRMHAALPVDFWAQYVPQRGTPKAYVFDIDGTLALRNGRDPYDLTLVGTDLPNPPVVSLAKTLYAAGFKLLVVTGRDSSSADDTLGWLDRLLDDTYVDCFMRSLDDDRDDSVVKIELFNENIRDLYDVQGVFDDRQRVVNAWRRIGLTVFQVAEGDF